MQNLFISTNGLTTLQFNSPPLREGGEQPQLIQASGFDSAGALHVYDRLVSRTVHRIVFPRLPDSTLASARTFLEITAQGMQNPFVWWDHLGVPHTVRYLAPELRHRQIGPNQHRLEIELQEDADLDPPAVADWDTAKNAATGSCPIWILKITVEASDYYLSGSAITITGWGGIDITTLPWIKSFGVVQGGVTNGLREYKTSGFSCDVLVDPDPEAATNIKTLYETCEIEQNPAVLYLWFRGLDAAASPPQEKWRGHIRDAEAADETIYRLELEDESIRLNNKIGTLLDSGTYPNADTRDVGKMLPIPYGDPGPYPALGADVGLKTTLAAAITATASTLTLSSGAGWASGHTLVIDSEEMLVTAINGSTATVTRGINATLAAVHNQGATAWQQLSEYVFIAAGVAVDSINQVLARMDADTELDITSVCTLYTGQAGNAHPSGRYPGRAVVSMPGRFTINQLAALGVVEDIAVDQGEHTHETQGNRLQIATNIGVQYGGSTSTSVTVTPAYAAISGIIEQTNSYDFAYGGNALAKNVYVNGSLVQSGLASSPSVKWSGSTVGLPNIQVTCGSQNVTVTINSAQRSVIYDSVTTTEPAAGVARTGDPTALTGDNTVTLVTNGVLVDVTRNIYTPAAVAADILSTWCNDTTLQQTGDFPAGYRLDVVISEYKDARYWLDSLAFQSRAWFCRERGISKLIVRPDIPIPTKTITVCRIDNGRMVHSIKKISLDDIINVINLRYGRDWRQSRGAEAYNGLIAGRDAESILYYGEHEQQDLFMCDFICDAFMAQSIANFYLNAQSRRARMHTFETYLENEELIFGDQVTLGFAGGIIGTVVSPEIAPGAAHSMDTIRLSVLDHVDWPYAEDDYSDDYSA